MKDEQIKKSMEILDLVIELAHKCSELKKPKWQPKNGEMIEVSDCDFFVVAKFIGMEDGRFVARFKSTGISSWEFAGPIHTIQKEIDLHQSIIDNLKKKL